MDPLRQMTPEDIAESQRKLLKKSQEYFGAFNEQCQEGLEALNQQEEEEEEGNA